MRCLTPERSLTKYWASIFCLALTLVFLAVSGCAGDRYTAHEDLIKGHVTDFYLHLGSHKIPQAVSENERIEAVAQKSEERLLRKVGQLSQAERREEWKLITTAKQTAAENWLALARYFTQRKDYDQARGTYRRVIETYEGRPYQSYVEQAKRGIRDIDTILNPTEPVLPHGKPRE